MRAALVTVFGPGLVLSGGLLCWGLLREFHDLQRSYALALGTVGLVVSVAALLTASRR